MRPRLLLTVCSAVMAVSLVGDLPARGSSTGKSAARVVLSAQESALLRQRAEIQDKSDDDLYFPTFTQGDQRRKEIALTFDDGPHPQWTPQLLELLKRLHVRATFFLVGKMVDKYPDLAVRELLEGHELANHTYDHPNLKKLTLEQTEKELKDGAEAIRRAVGYSPVFFRPPGGQYNAVTLRAAAELKMTPVLWTANSKDFLYPDPQLLEQRLLAGPENGGILLCHDGIPQTMQILPDLVARLRAEGYTFVTVTELARHAKKAANNP